VVVEDWLPTEVTFVDASTDSGTCQLVLPSTVECQLNDLDPGDYVLVYITVLVDPSVPDGTFISNTAEVSSTTTDPYLLDNAVEQITEVLAEADLKIEKDINFETGNASTTIIYFITVTNMGPSDAQNVTVVDELPSVTTGGGKQKVLFVFTTVGDYDPFTHEVTYEHGTLAAGHSFTVEIHIQVAGSVKDLLYNTATVTSDTNDPGPHPNTVTKTATVKGGSDRPGGPKGGRGHNK